MHLFGERGVAVRRTKPLRKPAEQLLEAKCNAVGILSHSLY